MVHIASQRKTSALKRVLDSLNSPAPPAPLKMGYMDSMGVFWHPGGGNQAFGCLWIDRSMLDMVRPFGWRLLQYQRGNDMVEVGRSQDVAMKFMENTDERS